jgi:hypothetical protein
VIVERLPVCISDLEVGDEGFGTGDLVGVGGRLAVCTFALAVGFVVGFAVGLAVGLAVSLAVSLVAGDGYSGVDVLYPG